MKVHIEHISEILKQPSSNNTSAASAAEMLHPNPVADPWSSTPAPGQLFEAICTPSAISKIRHWYSSLGEFFRETHLLTFLRKCTDLSDALILDIFDLLDYECKGSLAFTEIYFLISLLVAKEEGNTQKFLYQRGSDAARLLLSRRRPPSEAAHMSAAKQDPSQQSHQVDHEDWPMNAKVAIADLFLFLRVFDMDSPLSAKLTELRIGKGEMKASDLQVLLFALCKDHDEAILAETQGGTAKGAENADPEQDASSEMDSSPSREAAPEMGSKSTKICCVS